MDSHSGAAQPPQDQRSCDARGLGDGSPTQIARFVDTVRRRARDRLGAEVYIIINQAGFDPRLVPQVGADAA